MSHECPECTFVSSKENIYIAPNVVRGLGFEPLYIGKFTMPRWSGHNNFYAFVCKGCNQVVVDHPHGWMYLACFDCPGGVMTYAGLCTILEIKDKEIYKREGLSVMSERAKKKELKKTAEEMGLKPVLSGKDLPTVLVKESSPLARKLFPKKMPLVIPIATLLISVALLF